MAQLIIHHEKVTDEIAKQLTALCPFSAISYENGRLEVNAACKMCRLCVKKGPAGIMEYRETPQTTPQINKDDWKGIAVLADCERGTLHPVTLELLGKARELAKVTGHPVYALIIGENTERHAEELLHYGADWVYYYSDPMFRDFCITTYANAFEDFIRKVRPSSVLVGATNMGRSLAPRVAARFQTGLTADCTVLEMRENTDLIQIRPAFGGNIMAQIISPKTRPQFCTVRYKIFSAPAREAQPQGETVLLATDPAWCDRRVTVLKSEEKPRVTDISDSDVIVAVGRGFKSPADLEPARQLAELLGAQLACTRPLVESGWLDASHQIGLSGKTVKPKLIITLGISGAVQFAAGMKSADCIISVNQDKNAPIFDVAHYCAVGDLYEILPALIQQIREGHIHVS